MKNSIILIFLLVTLNSSFGLQDIKFGHIQKASLRKLDSLKIEIFNKYNYSAKELKAKYGQTIKPDSEISKNTNCLFYGDVILFILTSPKDSCCYLSSITILSKEVISEFSKNFADLFDVKERDLYKPEDTFVFYEQDSSHRIICIDRFKDKYPAELQFGFLNDKMYWISINYFDPNDVKINNKN